MIESAVPCLLKVSGDGNPCCEEHANQHNYIVRSTEGSLAFLPQTCPLPRSLPTVCLAVRSQQIVLFSVKAIRWQKDELRKAS